MNARCNKIILLVAGVIPACALATVTPDHVSRVDAQDIESISSPNMTIPLTSWPVDTKSFIDQHRAAIKDGNLKAATDRATVYRPVKVCRLVDTRGGPAFISIPGPVLAGSITDVNSSGVCGIPAGTGVAGISISFHVLNLTPNNGGTIAFLQQGAPLTGVNAVFNPGAIWTAATANISLPDDSGNFEISITNSNVQVVVDVNGYYQDMDFVDTGPQELDFHGNVSCVAPGCKVLEVTNEGNGAALAATNLGGGPGFRIGLGSFNVAGADIDSGTAAFVFEVNTAANICSGTPSEAQINHPMLNGDGSALVLVTPREGTVTSIGGTAPAGSAGSIAAVYHACGTADPNSRWGIRDKSGASLVNHSQYSVFIIKNQ
jgi:hypothetical protein